MQESNLNSQTFYAYAKVNLSLEILHKRPDGFHELVSVMQTVGLYDIIRLTPAPDLQFDCNLPELVEEDNLVWRAALLMHEQCADHQKSGVDIYLEKQIPVAAGLGGGSSDAATTMVALNRLWNLQLDEERLVELAAELGSDVPFFIRGGTALVEGRGERLTPLPAMHLAPMVLLYPMLDLPGNKTRELYKMLDLRDFSNGGVTRALVRTIQRGEPPPQSLFYNSFERVVYERFSQLDYFRQAMVEAGADHVQVSGSGPTLYSMYEDEEEAQVIASRLQNKGLMAYAVNTVQP